MQGIGHCLGLIPTRVLPHTVWNSRVEPVVPDLSGIGLQRKIKLVKQCLTSSALIKTVLEQHMKHLQLPCLLSTYVMLVHMRAIQIPTLLYCKQQMLGNDRAGCPGVRVALE